MEKNFSFSFACLASLTMLGFGRYGEAGSFFGDFIGYVRYVYFYEARPRTPAAPDAEKPLEAGREIAELPVEAVPESFGAGLPEVMPAGDLGEVFERAPVPDPETGAFFHIRRDVVFDVEAVAGRAYVVAASASVADIAYPFPYRACVGPRVYEGGGGRLGGYLSREFFIFFCFKRNEFFQLRLFGGGRVRVFFENAPSLLGACPREVSLFDFVEDEKTASMRRIAWMSQEWSPITACLLL